MAYSRRLMEKDNKKAREDARREYNDTIRVNYSVPFCFECSLHFKSLAKFLKKRDPRHKAYTAQQQASTSATGTPSKRIVKAENSYVEQDWQKIDAKLESDLEWLHDDQEQEEWECIACSKSFQSEASWFSHERSRKHMKQVEMLRMEMVEEDEELQLGEGVENIDLNSDNDEEDKQLKVEKDEQTRDAAEEHEDIHRDEEKTDTETVVHSASLRNIGLPRYSHFYQTKDKNLSPSNKTEKPIVNSTSSLEAELTKREKRRAKQTAKKLAEDSDGVRFLGSFQFDFRNRLTKIGSESM